MKKNLILSILAISMILLLPFSQVFANDAPNNENTTVEEMEEEFKKLVENEGKEVENEGKENDATDSEGATNEDNEEVKEEADEPNVTVKDIDNPSVPKTGDGTLSGTFSNNFTLSSTTYLLVGLLITIIGMTYYEVYQDRR